MSGSVVRSSRSTSGSIAGKTIGLMSIDRASGYEYQMSSDFESLVTASPKENERLLSYDAHS